jgi:cytochrome c
VNDHNTMKTKATAALGATWLAAALAWLAVPDPVRAADDAHGKQVFAACAACHSDKPDAIGPSLRGVFGRKSGTLGDFRYSNAMRRAGLVWNEDNLRAYIKDPQSKVPGNRMPFGGLRTDKDLDDVIGYLKTYR